MQIYNVFFNTITRIFLVMTFCVPVSIKADNLFLNDPLLKPLTDDYVLQSLELIALRNEYDPGKILPLRKWVRPIRVFVDSRAGFKKIQMQLLRDHIRVLADITNHRISLTNIKTDANVFVIFALEKEMLAVAGEYIGKTIRLTKAFEEGVCIANFTVNIKSEITSALVFIPPDKARYYAKLPACVVEEITQIMGLPNDSNDVYPSIFNDSSVDDELSTLDLILLQILYNQRLKAGMTKKQVFANAKVVLQQIRHKCQSDESKKSQSITCTLLLK